MKRVLFIIFLAISTIAFPQQAGPRPKEYTITLNVDEINVILTMLAKGPYESVAPVIGKIQQQVQAQMAETKEKEKQ